MTEIFCNQLKNQLHQYELITEDFDFTIKNRNQVQ